MDIKELQELSRYTINRFKKVEPKEWGIEGTIIELIGEVGSLAHCTMIQEKYKLGPVDISKIKDEVSDVLFVIFKLVDICDVTLPKQITIELTRSTLAKLTIDLGRHLGLILNQIGTLQNSIDQCPISANISANLIEMICILGQIANLLGFSLEAAHRNELRIAELWLDTKLRRGGLYELFISKVKFWFARNYARYRRK